MKTLLHRIVLILTVILIAAAAGGAPVVATVDQVQPKVVKVYGAGGVQGMANYQSGIVISATGHVLTTFSHVLDTDYIDVVLSDGRKFSAKLLGADPRLEVAVLKIDATGLPWFDLAKATDAEAGTRILCFSNIFSVAMGDEQASVQRGTVAVRTRLEARRGVFETPYRGPVYVLDVTTNNPGAAGGALVSFRGELLGVLGKELRNSLNNTWLNYAVPISELRESVEEILAGKFVARRDAPEKKPERPLNLAALGIVLVPDMLERTPPYVDRVQPASVAAKAGMQPDDLILLCGDRLTQSCKALQAELQGLDYEDPVKLTVLRGQQLIEFTLQSVGPATSKKGQP
ncbi:MAG: S1C family serine protease [Planctomycetaceae bacterium]|nr:S1C family serine protease [Planctomycetaceae bacterium]